MEVIRLATGNGLTHTRLVCCVVGDQSSATCEVHGVTVHAEQSGPRTDIPDRTGTKTRHLPERVVGR